MRYHINYDGKILPCRAKVKACPYGPARHANSYEDLYYRYNDQFNSIEPSGELKDKLSAGKPLRSISELNEQLETSKSPIELLSSTFKEALENAGKGNISKEDNQLWNDSIQAVRAQLIAGRNIPDGIPKEVRDAGNSAFEQDHSGMILHFKHNLQAAHGNWQMLIDNTPALKRIANERANTFQMSESQLVNYKQAIKGQFNKYANLLNTRKLISQPMLIDNNEDKIQENLKNMSDDELLSLYDDCTVSDREIIKRLETVDDFNFQPIRQLTPAANENLRKWYKSSQDAEQRYIVGSASRTLIALYAADTLYNRNKNYGDLVYTVTEESEDK